MRNPASVRRSSSQIDEYFLGSWDDFERAIREEFCFFHIAGVSQALSRNIYTWYADESEAAPWRPVLKEITFIRQARKVGESPGTKKLAAALQSGTRIITEGHFAKMLAASEVDETD